MDNKYREIIKASVTNASLHHETEFKQLIQDYLESNGYPPDDSKNDAGAKMARALVELACESTIDALVSIGAIKIP